MCKVTISEYDNGLSPLWEVLDDPVDDLGAVGHLGQVTKLVGHL